MESSFQMKGLIVLLFLSINYFSFSQGGESQSKQMGAKKVALVIGAQSYTVLPPLRNSVNDAKSMAAALQAKGFQVDALYNPKTKKEMKDAITRYYNLMKDQVDAVGIIYYAGHGMQLDGNNYLIPTTASLQIPDDLDDQCVKMNAVMSVLKASSSSLNILLLDACRSLPSFSRDSEQGWTKMEAPRGSIIVFATEAGKVASDGNGKNGLFTSKLLNVINQPGLNITEVFKKVKQDVYQESEQKQLPSVEDNSIGGDFYFTPIVAPVVNTPQTAQSETVKETIQPEAKKESVISSSALSVVDGIPVTIGSQQWLNKNLSVTNFANGEPIPEARTMEEWKKAGENKQPAWCNYDNGVANGKSYGKLYNWFAVADSRGLCPAGSHIPTDKEWESLVDFLGKNPGKQLKASTLWSQSSTETDSHNFTALPGGMRYGTGKFESLGKESYWWTATEVSTSYAMGRSIRNISALSYKANYRKEDGFSVRCVKE
jgi:uncharacterized protein (TIGR02145 family)